MKKVALDVPVSLTVQKTLPFSEVEPYMMVNDTRQKFLQLQMKSGEVDLPGLVIVCDIPEEQGRTLELFGMPAHAKKGNWYSDIDQTGNLWEQAMTAIQGMYDTKFSGALADVS